MTTVRLLVLAAVAAAVIAGLRGRHEQCPTAIVGTTR